MQDSINIKTTFGFFFLLFQTTFSQNTTSSKLVLDYAKIYAHCLNADVLSAMPLLTVDEQHLNEKDIDFVSEFNSRFAHEVDNSAYFSGQKSKIHELHVIFKDYWRKSLLNPDEAQERTLGKSAIGFLKKNYPPAKDKKITRDSLGYFLSNYIKSKGYYTTEAVGKTGRLLDLLIWKSQRDTTYTFNLKSEKLEVKVVFMNDFITLGWEEYATLGKYYPGGWAKNDAIYCVEEAYDLESENFKISYLAHEGRHFVDYKAFPNLKGPDLEYRAKLSELSLAQETIYDLIRSFTSNANPESENPHPLANYCVIRDLSKMLFKTDFQKDASQWKTISAKKINKTAFSLLKNNTKALRKKGKSVERYIKA